MDTSTMIEAKKEYTTQLQQILSPRIYERFKFIFDGTIQVVQKELAMSQVQSGSVMKIFQKQLSSIKDWNESNIIEEYERIKSRSKCNYLDKLIKAVIIANMKILSTIQYGARKSKSKIQVHIPTPTHFIHRCYVECAKEIYKNPYIFDMSSSLSSKEKHQNLRDSLLIIDNGISSAIRQLLPIGDLLEQNFNSDVEDDDDESTVESRDHRGHRQKGGSVTSSEDESDEEEMSSDDETSTGGGSSEEEDEEEDEEDGGSDEGGHESDMSSISSGTASEEEEEEEDATLGGGQSQKSESSISKRSQALASRVESYLEDQTADDIQISIGGDKETQSMLANVMEQRAEESGSTSGYFGGGVPPPTPNSTPVSSPVYSPAPIQPPPQPQSSGGFLGALYTTFASSRNMKPNADDVSVPTVKSNPPPTSTIYGGAPQYQQQRPEEVKQIVFSGTTKLPPGFASMPVEPPKPVIATPAPAAPAPTPAPTPALAPMSAPVPAVNPNYGIYPPRAPTPPQSPVYQQPMKPTAPKPIAPTQTHSQSHMVRPQMGSKKLSLKEQKYGVKSSSSSAIQIESDDDASFHF